jgi:hypothetical protein
MQHPARPLGHLVAALLLTIGVGATTSTAADDASVQFIAIGAGSPEPQCIITVPGGSGLTTETATCAALHGGLVLGERGVERPAPAPHTHSRRRSLGGRPGHGANPPSPNGRQALGPQAARPFAACGRSGHRAPTGRGATSSRVHGALGGQARVLLDLS